MDTLREQPRPSAEDSLEADKAEIDSLMAAFLGAFTNTEGAAADVERVRGLFIPEGMIVSMAAGDPVIYDLDAFIDPRKKMLADGTLTEFSEWEIAEATEIFGRVAHRFSSYGKSGRRDGVPFEGEGRKTTQFIRTSAGWRMTSMAWDDVV